MEWLWDRSHLVVTGFKQERKFFPSEEDFSCSKLQMISVHSFRRIVTGQLQPFSVPVRQYEETAHESVCVGR